MKHGWMSLKRTSESVQGKMSFLAAQHKATLHSMAYFQTISRLPLSIAHTGDIFSSAVRIAFSTESQPNPLPESEYSSSILVSSVGWASILRCPVAIVLIFETRLPEFSKDRVATTTG